VGLCSGSELWVKGVVKVELTGCSGLKLLVSVPLNCTDCLGEERYRALF
jgi:hypothetical protein